MGGNEGGNCRTSIAGSLGYEGGNRSLERRRRGLELGRDDDVRRKREGEQRDLWSSYENGNKVKQLCKCTMVQNKKEQQK